MVPSGLARALAWCCAFARYSAAPLLILSNQTFKPFNSSTSSSSSLVSNLTTLPLDFSTSGGPELGAELAADMTLALALPVLAASVADCDSFCNYFRREGCDHVVNLEDSQLLSYIKKNLFQVLQVFALQLWRLLDLVLRANRRLRTRLLLLSMAKDQFRIFKFEYQIANRFRSSPFLHRGCRMSPSSCPFQQ